MLELVVEGGVERASQLPRMSLQVLCAWCQLPGLCCVVEAAACCV